MTDFIGRHKAFRRVSNEVSRTEDEWKIASNPDLRSYVCPNNIHDRTIRYLEISRWYFIQRYIKHEHYRAYTDER